MNYILISFAIVIVGSLVYTIYLKSSKKYDFSNYLNGFKITFIATFLAIAYSTIYTLFKCHENHEPLMFITSFFIVIYLTMHQNKDNGGVVTDFGGLIGSFLFASAVYNPFIFTVIYAAILGYWLFEDYSENCSVESRSQVINHILIIIELFVLFQLSKFINNRLSLNELILNYSIIITIFNLILPLVNEYLSKKISEYRK